MDFVCVNTSMWQEPPFSVQSRGAKILYWFFRTNALINASGIYPVPFTELEKAVQTRRPQLLRFLEELPRIEFDHDRQVVFIREHYRIVRLHDASAEERVRIENANTPTYLWRLFAAEYPDAGRRLKKYDEIPVPLRLQSADPGAPVRGDIHEKEKCEYAAHVLLTQEEHRYLGQKYGVDNRDRAIQLLDAYKAKKKRSYKSDLVPLETWVMSHLRTIQESELADGGPKRRYAHCVWLRAHEFTRLSDLLGPGLRDDLINRMNDYKRRRSRNYSSDFVTIVKWAGRDQTDPSGVSFTKPNGKTGDSNPIAVHAAAEGN